MQVISMRARWAPRQLILALAVPVFLFLLGFGIWLVHFGPASSAGG